MNQRIQNLIAKLPEGVDGALITSTVNRYYLSGMHSTAGNLLVTRDGAYALFDFRYIEAARKTVKNCEVVLMEKVEDQLGELIKKHNLHRLALETSYQTIGEMNRFYHPRQNRAAGGNPAGIFYEAGRRRMHLLQHHLRRRSQFQYAPRRPRDAACSGRGFSHHGFWLYGQRLLL